MHKSKLLLFNLQDLADNNFWSFFVSSFFWVAQIYFLQVKA